MRFVDLDDLDFPVDWQARADAALNALRQEVVDAENAATAAGQDIATARKAAVSRGLKIKAREDVWKDLMPHLQQLSMTKCWYSEGRNAGSDKNVDHFRPKARVDEDSSHEGYWWLAFDWRNFRYSSQWCNQRRNERINGTSGGKGDHFPLENGSARARRESDWLQEELPLLLDPTDPEDWKLLTFRPDGHPIPAKPTGTLEHIRASTSIELYHLHCKELVDARKPLAGMVQRLVEEMELHLPQIASDPGSKSLYKTRQKGLLRMIRKNADYSAAALAYARGQVYKLELGHQVKRDWLEDLLNSQA